jgi:DNA-binding response OmpR family regulator
MNKTLQILWVDDEIDLLKPYFVFLKEKGYDILYCSNGTDALQIVNNNAIDIVILDENMPGLSGLQVLDELKRVKPLLPVIMVTKSEEENIMDSALGSNIADYLIKPVNPKQLLLAIKKIVEKERLVSEKSVSQYLTEFNKLSQQIQFAKSIDDWKEIYTKLTFFDEQLEHANEQTMIQLLHTQYKEANQLFGKYIKTTYQTWFDGTSTQKPILSANLLQKKFFPIVQNTKRIVLILIDNLRYDHWLAISKHIFPYYNIETDLYVSILPTATSYSRNAIFSGLMPSEIEKIFPEIWLNDDDEGLKNQYEEELFFRHCQRLGIKEPFFFKKIITNYEGKNFLNELPNIFQKYNNGVIIYNFIDILSHSQTESKTVKELSDTDLSYKSIVSSWFEHSPLFEIIKKLQEYECHLFITTDHGSIRVENPVKVIGEKNITTNLRYKQGKNMNYPAKEVIEFKNPQSVFLPKTNVAATYIFALNNDYFVYPNNYNQYVKMFRNTYQHGGVSLDEMLIPYAILSPKK